MRVRLQAVVTGDFISLSVVFYIRPVTNMPEAWHLWESVCVPSVISERPQQPRDSQPVAGAGRAALLTAGGRWERPRRPPRVNGHTKRGPSAQGTAYRSASERRMRAPATAPMDLEDAVPGGTGQSRTGKDCMIPFTRGS